MELSSRPREDPDIHSNSSTLILLNAMYAVYVCHRDSMMVSKYIQSNAGPDAGPSEIKAPLNLGNKNNMLKSVHFKNTVARSSVLSKT